MICCAGTGSLNVTTTKANTYVGGIVGKSMFATLVRDCYSTGQISGTAIGSRCYAGGCVGYTTTDCIVGSCYSTGEVSATGGTINYAGGVVAYNYQNSNVESCYSAASPTLWESVQGAAVDSNTKSLTAEQFKDAANFTGWDFDNIWIMGSDAPQLRSLQLFAVAYVDVSGEEKERKYGEYTELKDQTELADGWYAVRKNVQIESRITVKGHVNLILCDGAELTVPNGINVPGGGYLTIYGQTGGTGKLTVTSPQKGYAAIGGGYSGSAGDIVINGGNITAQGGAFSPAIGSGGGYGVDGKVTINGGVIHATGGSGGSGGGAAIGTSHRSGKLVSGRTFTVNINGGEIDARGGNFASGIGGGSDRCCEVAINISGGTIDATGGIQGAGIGGGRAGTGGTINISGGSITAAGGSFNGGSGAGIGGGNTGAGGVINITGGTITATPGSESDTQAIGHGSGSEASGTLTLGNAENHIKAGTVSGGKVTYVDADKRVSTAQSHNTVHTEVCTNHNYNYEGICQCGSETTAYIITFVNEDGTVLQSGRVRKGLTPVYKGSIPEKQGNEYFAFLFDGWSPK